MPRWILLILMLAVASGSLFVACSGGDDDDDASDDDTVDDDDLSCPLPELLSAKEDSRSLSPLDSSSKVSSCEPYGFDDYLEGCVIRRDPLYQELLSPVAFASNPKLDEFAFIWREYDEGDKSSATALGMHLQFFPSSGAPPSNPVEFSLQAGPGGSVNQAAMRFDEDKVYLVAYEKKLEEQGLYYYVLDRQTAEILEKRGKFPFSSVSYWSSMHEWNGGYLILTSYLGSYPQSNAVLGIIEDDGQISDATVPLRAYDNVVGLAAGTDRFAFIYDQPPGGFFGENHKDNTRRLFVVVYDKSYTKVGDPIQVSENEEGWIRDAAVQATDDGGWLIAWVYEPPVSPPRADTFFAVYDRDLNLVRGPETAHLPDAGTQSGVDLVRRTDGGIQLFWSDYPYPKDTFCNSIRGRILNLADCPDGPTERAIEALNLGSPERLRGLPLADGKSVVLTSGGEAMWFQVLDAYGSPLCAGER